MIVDAHMGSEATSTVFIIQKSSRESTNLNVGLQSGASIIGHLTGLVHHLHLLHHKIHLAKSLPGILGESSGVCFKANSDGVRVAEAATGSDAWSCTGAVGV